MKSLKISKHFCTAQIRYGGSKFRPLTSSLEQLSSWVQPWLS